MTGPPDFRDLVGDEQLPAEEQARLERVHDLLVEAGPPPELPPSLAEAPHRGPESPSWLPRRRLGAALTLAAAIALIAFLGGYVAGFNHGNDGFSALRQVSLHGTAAAPPTAAAVIKLGTVGDGGNWPMKVTVHGLPRLPGDEYYVLLLTRNGKPVAPCGWFNVRSGTTTVEFTVPYSIKPSDGWVVTRHDPSQDARGDVVLTT
ncbi:MAG: hypothetical protein ABI896_02945 [Actinomycetota bacterium]